jgi:hypothetical protein
MIGLPQWTLPELDRYVEIALGQMGRNRDVRTDAEGHPLYDVLAAGRTADGKLRIDLKADLSGIGLPTNAPITVMAEGAGPVAWFLGDVLIATTPGEWMPEEAGEALTMDKLHAAHRRWAGRASGRRWR